MKTDVLAAAQKHIQTKLLIAQKEELAAQKDANSETKSTAGDKYETARAMGQIQREMYAKQVKQLEQELQQIVKLEQQDIQTEKILLGSLVYTSTCTFFIGISIGPLKVKEDTILLVSAVSPIGQSLLGKMVGDTFEFQGKGCLIEAIA